MAKAGLGPLPPELAGGAEDDPQATRPLPEGLALPPPPAAPLPPAFAPRPGADPAAPGLASPLAAAKPAWQLALDRTLVDLARRGERIAARASALPPTTRIAVIAGASFAVVFVCALLFVRYALS